MIALVTGSNKGIGKEIARGLISRGHTVYVAARDRARGEAAAAEIGAKFVQLDVTSPESCAQAAAQVEKEAGALDVLVNNAGVFLEPAGPSAATLEGLRKTFETNLFGVVTCTQAFLPLMKKSNGRRIVNVSSGLGSLALHTDLKWDYASVIPLAYNASKAALNMFTVLLAKELPDFKVNSINPGYVATDLNNHQGYGTAADGARIAIEAAVGTEAGKTASFLSWGETLPW